MSGSRCPICGARGRHVRVDGMECDHCGIVLLADADPDPHVLRANVRGWLSALATPAGWRLEGHAVRNAAWSLGLVSDGCGWRDAVPIDHDVTLAIMARREEAASVAALVRASAFPRAAVLFDAPAAETAALAAACPGARVAAHLLDGDFAAQRNRLQRLAAPGWVLHLDSDEAADDALARTLGWLTRAADREGICALGLPRRNLVDGRLSDLYPDIQYRLVGSGLRFEGRVHERPVVPFERTSLALAAALTHRLTGERVRRRTIVYGGMAEDGARAEDEAALLRCYRGPPSTVA